MKPEEQPEVRPGLSGLTPEALAAWLAERGVPAYRARQVGDAVWGGAIRPRCHRALEMVPP